MNREILYRAKQLPGNNKHYSHKKFVEGFYFYDLSEQKHFIKAIIREDNCDVQVDIPVNPDTVCQFTGLTDKNGAKIFEGDIVKITDGGDDEINPLNSDTGIGIVEWLNKYGFWNVSQIENSLGDLININDTLVEKLGNLFDNPELLEQFDDARLTI